VPGETVELTFACPAPVERGAGQMKIDLVAEGVTWFEPTGSSTAVIPLEVE
jgi:hypothetical protein